jgi:hypothetical protein
MGIGHACNYATTTLRLFFSPSFKVDNFLFENHPRRPTCVPLLAIVTIKHRSPMLIHFVHLYPNVHLYIMVYTIVYNYVVM